ncbi:OPT superfamily oligopeptide transporter [Basidiobolus meristosporus CBS 931.73]|uniref:OPT superfamily oligopeptide transporter n=1 Tax=Basidiobolus meristosporus CBS 931.73 TaxID=1314790 RepID=A0A1Y1Z149_9FUNG|nr:OPT superfamily oligopeptide transporter [Basidiobolus meristosporus CBS 931.73]|eukprot:ORY03545.1 OPT superfamily oligopeptide transporter [Basidiobolus meristosporus CBS 931.73]
MVGKSDEQYASSGKGYVLHNIPAEGLNTPLSEIVEERQFTVRAIVVGTILGGFVSASNLYIGLKVGWVFGASMFGALFGFAILKPFSRMTGSYFGPKENCVVQTAATTTGGLYVGFFTAIPALYHLGLMSPNFMDDIPALLLWTTGKYFESCAAAFFGLFFAVPLRKYFVIKQKLPFPSPTATAETIRQLHATMTGEREAMQKAKVMLGCFMASSIIPIIGVFFPLLEYVHLLYWIGVATGSQGLISADRVWKWVINLDPAFLGAGTLIPSNTVVSLFLGQLVSYGIAGPLMLASGNFVKATGFVSEGPTAQSWFLWPGIVLMLASSFTELFCNGGSILRAVHGAFSGLYGTIKHMLIRRNPVHEESLKDEEDDDPAPRNERIPTWMWAVGLTIAVVFNCLSILAIFVAFVLSFVGLQSVAGSIGKTSQLIFSQFSAPSLADVQRLNLMAGNVAGSASYQAVDMVKDLLTGHILGGSPLAQFYTQLIGSFFAIFIAVGIFILYASAYPCVTDANSMPCDFQLIGVVAWKNVAVTMTTGLDIPYDSKMFSVACGVFAVVYTVLKKLVIPVKYHPYLLNVNAFGIGFVNADPGSAFGMLCGNLFFLAWRLVRPKRAEFYHYSVGGGLLAGAGIAGLVKAMLQHIWRK